MNSREGDLRSLVFNQIDNQRTRQVKEVYACETDNGILCEVISGNSSFDDKVNEMTSAARALTEESDTVSILHVQPSSTEVDRVGEVKVTNSDFSDMSDISQRLHVSHGLTLL